jgi:hypothetical protein
MTLIDQISLMNSLIKENRDVEIWEFLKTMKEYDIRAANRIEKLRIEKLYGKGISFTSQTTIK